MIPYGRQNINEEDIEAVIEVLKSDFITQGPVVPEFEKAVAKYRKIMGATNPAEAEQGTIRKLYAETIEANSVHGSDSEENAKIEISFFFSGSELV